MTKQAAVPSEPGSANVTLLPHLISVAKAIRQFSSLKLADCSVVPGQDQYLLCFGDGEAVSVAGLADRLSVRASTVSKMTDILQRKGWVGRQADDHDARKVLVHLTSAGLAARDAVRAVEAEMESELWLALGRDEAILPSLARLDDVLAKRLRRLR